MHGYAAFSDNSIQPIFPLFPYGKMNYEKWGIFDWVYLPSTGRLWMLGSGSPSGGTDLLRFDMTAHTWSVRAYYPTLTEPGYFGAMYGINNGTFYASANSNGNIWAIDTTGARAPDIVSNGPPSASNDGTRCVLNMEVS
ncbi:hypothetical protein Sste5346_007461 [Sporothrix stenoceras]|uniref:DUF6923 domain-containing protein n=1 Tax=Sporothrix stenoceras TaxID=5173 RepID=A0ABR3YV05_9PEZI